MSADKGKIWQRAEDIPQGDTAVFIEHPFDNRLVGIIYSVLFVTPQCMVPLDIATFQQTPCPTHMILSLYAGEAWLHLSRWPQAWATTTRSPRLDRLDAR